MWNNEAELDAALRRVDAWQASFADRAERVAELSRRLAGLRVTTRGADGLVEVTLDTSGMLVDLWLDERTRQQPAAQVAVEIVATVRAARTELLHRMTEATVESLGAGDPAGQALVDSYASRLAAPETEASGRG
ncbi:YbaB/EbfC family nucleoid-associated protein, partial [Plantactinospora sp. KLBMP9567]|uniref:YbaB/EbfC family nucleoid-associated protein n=1 Tax=Plantactinospora sp. KLBMP9567 TaxID=3085900 RepID=UPI002982B81E